jgi:arabinofuranosyltransferase
LLADIKRLAKHPAIVETVALVIGVSLVVAQAATLPGRVARDHDEAWLEGRFESVTAMERFARVRIAAGTALRSEVPEDTLVVVGAAGALPYASELPAVDAYGLVDPGVLANTRPRVGEGARPGHQLHASLDYLRTLDPDLLCHVGHVGPRRPSRRAAVQKAGPGSVWACVETGPIPDRRSDGGVMDGSFYCCIRHADDVVGNFGGSEG